MASDMNVLLCVEPGMLRQQRQPLPEPGAGEVLLKMRALGVCGSDIHAFHGRQPMMHYPVVLGHEISAEVVRCGADACQFRPGQQVIVIPYRPCGHCLACQRGRPTCCTTLSVMGVHRGGAMQEYVVVSESALIAVDDIDPVQAALIEPYAIAAHAVRRSGVAPGDYLLVSGAGTIGLAVADISRSRGAKVIIAEANPHRQLFASRQFGFHPVVNPLDANFDELLLALTNNNGPWVTIDATGNASSMNSQVARMAAGGTLVFVGLHHDDVRFSDLDFHKRELDLRASRAASREDFETVIDLMRQGKISPLTLCTGQVAFSELDQSRFIAMTQPDNIKIVITF